MIESVAMLVNGKYGNYTINHDLDVVSINIQMEEENFEALDELIEELRLVREMLECQPSPNTNNDKRYDKVTRCK